MQLLLIIFLLSTTQLYAADSICSTASTVNPNGVGGGIGGTGIIENGGVGGT